MSTTHPAFEDHRPGTRLKGAEMKNTTCELQKPSFWQLVFSQSKANGARYEGEQLEGYVWEWPKDTYLQRRLREVRWLPADTTTFN
jgi:hypothetical protein